MINISWNDTKNLNDELTHTEWNDMVSVISTISGNAILGYNWFTESSSKVSIISGSLSDRINLKQNTLVGDEYYPSSLGKGISSNVLTLTNWFVESGEKLSTISGNLNTKISGKVDGTTISSNFFTVGSGNTLWSWYTASASKLSESGSKYSELYNWYNTSANILSLYLASGDNYSNSYDWFVASSSKLSESGSKYSNAYTWYNESANKLSTISGSIQSKFILSDSYNASGAFYPSSLGKGVSGSVLILTDWFTASSSKLSVSEALAHSSVTLDGVPDYLTIVDQVITRTRLDLDEDTNFTAGLGITLATNTVSVTDYIASSVVLDKYIQSSVALSSFTGSSNVNINYIANVSSNAISAYNWTNTSGSILYYPSAMGVGTSGTVSTLVSFSSNAQSLYYPSMMGVGTSGTVASLILHSSNINIHILPISSSKYSDAYMWYSDSAQKLTDISGNLRTNFMMSSVALSTFAHSTNINDRFVGSSSALDKYMQSSVALSIFAGSSNLLANYYTSSLGKGVSGAVLTLTNWFTESGEKLSTISGSLSTRINASLLGTTASSNFFTVISGNNVYTWMTNSGSKYTLSSQMAHNKVTFIGTPDYLTISDQVITIGKLDLDDDVNFTTGIGITRSINTVSVTDYIASAGALDKFAGSSVTSLTNKWFTESGEKLSTISGSLASKINALGGFDPENYITSSNALSIFAHSTNINDRFKASSEAWIFVSSQKISGGSILTSDFNLNANTISGLIDPTYPSAATNKHYVDNLILNISSNFLPSTSTRYGWAYVMDGDLVSHTCSSKPNWVGIAPSGNSPISYSFKVDDTNITIYHTSPNYETFSWRTKV